MLGGALGTGGLEMALFRVTGWAVVAFALAACGGADAVNLSGPDGSTGDDGGGNGTGTIGTSGSGTANGTSSGGSTSGGTSGSSSATGGANGSSGSGSGSVTSGTSNGSNGSSSTGSGSSGGVSSDAGGGSTTSGGVEAGPLADSGSTSSGGVDAGPSADSGSTSGGGVDAGPLAESGAACAGMACSGWATALSAASSLRGAAGASADQALMNCVIQLHQSDCCGARRAYGFNHAARTQLCTAESSCPMTYPRTPGCTNSTITTDTGETTTNPNEVRLRVVNPMSCAYGTCYTCETFVCKGAGACMSAPSINPLQCG
jgi:hypothetical protein